MNVLNIDGVTYDIDKLGEDGQIACILLSKAQSKLQEQTIELDILKAAAVALTETVKDELTNDAIIEEEDTPTED
jgi:hypothetical protein